MMNADGAQIQDPIASWEDPGSFDPEVQFQKASSEAGRHAGLLETADIREHCSLVHMLARRDDAGKAEDLVRMAVAKAHILVSLGQTSYPDEKCALALGVGPAGTPNTPAFANRNPRAHLLESEQELGGNPKCFQKGVDLTVKRNTRACGRRDLRAACKPRWADFINGIEADGCVVSGRPVPSNA